MSTAMFNIFVRTVKRRMSEGEELDAILDSYPKLTEEEKEQARKEAYDQFQKEEVAKLRSQKKEPEEKEKKKAPAKSKPEPAFESPSLFDFGDEGEE